MKKDKKFELLTKDLILSALHSQISNGAKVVHHREKIKGKSGYTHEIDLAFTIDIAGAEILFLIECKCYKRKVSTDDVLTFAKRIDDISANKGILIATVGFTEGAIKLARAHRIALAIAKSTAIHYVHKDLSPYFLMKPRELPATGLYYMGTKLELKGDRFFILLEEVKPHKDRWIREFTPTPLPTDFTVYWERQYGYHGDLVLDLVWPGEVTREPGRIAGILTK
ncbi:MAG: hypothetical protein GTO45_39625 [Candidatus Aminicenantes bacterium]|nr:hypothetical protein [Candidatus Aminicenantes bacterium]NIM82394.1 hypothetical protein [Candidatus Aminicenantes bacterium]NIN24231.1 hypothetical protein [Candidatus Aminicenantes bacterium]NIN47958.1 hypothetical protein [Candidatus Aminicenantes bacterium]NIN90894.1 hypothetical protein [Candidatus Aminicenantes bacterium]